MINWGSVQAQVNSVEETIHSRWEKQKPGVVFIYNIPANYLSRESLLEYIALFSERKVDGD